MAKKKYTRGPEEENDDRKGLSKEAWVTIGTIAAALITGVVTLIVHLYPKAPPSAAVQTPSPTLNAASPSPVSIVTADAIAGHWSGQAKDSSGKSFQITLDVRKSCSINEQCGSISVSHVPCYGEVFLDRATVDEFDFRVDNFYGQSDRKVCQPGGGEHFRLRPDGSLMYSTSYEPRAEGLLKRQGG